MIAWLIKLLFRNKVNDLLCIEQELDRKMNEKEVIYTTVRSFKGLDAEYYSWICDVVKKDCYRFFQFDLRENIIREMSTMNDEKEIIRQLGRLDMLNVIDNYFFKYKGEYENSIRRNSENTKE